MLTLIWMLACAKNEFMETGDQDASLRVIAAKAETATGSVYTRFRIRKACFF